MRYNDGRKVLKMFIEFIEIKRVRGKASRNIRMKSDSKRCIKTYLRKLRELWLRAKAELLLSAVTDEISRAGSTELASTPTRLLRFSRQKLN